MSKLPGIFYTIIARQEVALIEHFYKARGNIASQVRLLLGKITPNTSKSVVPSKNYTYHFINKNGVTFCCLTKDQQNVPQKFYMDFLDKISKEFFRMFDKKAI